MKRLILTAAILVSCWNLTQAQSSADPVIQEVDRLSKQLTLTENQQQEVTQIIAAGERTKAVVKVDPTLSPEVLAESLNTIQAKTDIQVAEQLDEKQKPVFEKIVSERPKETIPMPPQIPAQPVPSKKTDENKENKTP